MLPLGLGRYFDVLESAETRWQRALSPSRADNCKHNRRALSRTALNRKVEMFKDSP
jgi:hypothetical protein